MNNVFRFLAVMVLCALVVQPFPLLAQDEEAQPPEEPALPEAPVIPEVVPTTIPVPAAPPIATTAGLQIVTFPSSRPGVTLRLMIGTPASPPTAVLLQFTGVAGTNPFREEGGQVRVGTSFPARTTDRYLQQGLATALLDVPSDQPDGMSPQFRGGSAHVEDAAAVVAQLTARWPDKPLFIVGTSNGTISATNLGLNLNEPRVQGLILTSTVGLMASTMFTVANLPVEQLRLPVLMVHHRDDTCVLSPYDAANRVRARMTSSPKVDFVSVSGGTPLSGEPCAGVGPHVLAGRDSEIVAAIVDYVAGRPVPAQIG